MPLVPRRAGKVLPIGEQRAAAERISATIAAARAERAVDLANLVRLTGMQQLFTIAARWFDNTTSAPALEVHGTSLTIAVARVVADTVRARVDAVCSANSRP